ncbi:MAG: putative toxin-antitoxin system toxin component, PIN family [Anaerolineales bacterium]|nr:putative toxin-antitoxin system toxin component, PIN family [Anaerolineales bacterium]
MKVIIDTNVFISAVWRDRNPEAVVLWICDQPDWQWTVSKEIKKEYREVLRRKKFSFTPDVLEEWSQAIDENTTEVETDENINFPRDQKDAKFLACALSCEADYLITGDKDFTEAQRLVKTTIVSVSMFKNLFCDVG